MTRAYYSDGSYQDAPITNVRDVQAILQKVETDWRITSGSDYYVMRDGEWIGVDLFGLFDYLIDTRLVLFGRTVPNENYRQAMRAALEERDRRIRD